MPPRKTAVPLSSADLATLSSWRQAIGMDALASMLGCAAKTVEDCLRLRQVQPWHIERLRSFGEPPREVPCPRCDRGQMAPVVPSEPRLAMRCTLCREDGALRKRERNAAHTEEWRERQRVTKKCQRPGCSEPTSTPNARNCHAHSDRHTPPAVGRVETYAATVAACPHCGGTILRDGRLVSCRRRLACGWVDLTSRAIRGHETAP